VIIGGGRGSGDRGRGRCWRKDLASVKLSLVGRTKAGHAALHLGVLVAVVGCGRAGMEGSSAIVGPGDAPRPDAPGDATVSPPPDVASLPMPDVASLPMPEAGQPADAGPAVDGSCPPGAVSFRLTATTPSAWWYGWPCSFGSWLSIRDSADASLPLAAGCPAYVCSGCAQREPPCSFGCAASALPDAGATQIWDGRYFAPDTCNFYPEGLDGGPMPVLCGTEMCAPPGHYDAVMCATPPGGASTATCVHVPFDYPTSGEVLGTLP
jgi:hypothetical protein